MLDDEWKHARWRVYVFCVRKIKSWYLCFEDTQEALKRCNFCSKKRSKAIKSYINEIQLKWRRFENFAWKRAIGGFNRRSGRRSQPAECETSPLESIGGRVQAADVNRRIWTEDPTFNRRSVRRSGPPFQTVECWPIYKKSIRYCICRRYCKS